MEDGGGPPRVRAAGPVLKQGWGRQAHPEGCHAPTDAREDVEDDQAEDRDPSDRRFAGLDDLPRSLAEGEVPAKGLSKRRKAATATRTDFICPRSGELFEIPRRNPQRYHWPRGRASLVDNLNRNISFAILGSHRSHNLDEINVHEFLGRTRVRRPCVFRTNLNIDSGQRNQRTHICGSTVTCGRACCVSRFRFATLVECRKHA
jgi:hypothetical protein